MKKIFFTLVLILVGSFNLNSYPIPTDPPPCNSPGCDPLAWELYEVSILGIPQCPLCSINVYVKVNIPCKEMFVVSYSFINEPCTDCFLSQQWTWADVNREIIKYLLSYGPLAAYYTDQELEYKISQLACWKNGGGGQNPGMNDWWWQPCENDACCLRIYKIIKPIGMPPTYSFQGSQILGFQCTPPCGAICDFENWYPTIWILYNEESMIKFNENKLYPNPTNNIVTLKYQSEINGNVTFVMFNSNGQIVAQREFIKNNYDEEIKLDLSDISSGNYSYQLQINGTLVSSGKFILSK